MAQPKARLYQRLRTKGFPWVVVEFHKNGNPKPHANAFQLGVRYSLDGKMLDRGAARPGRTNVRPGGLKWLPERHARDHVLPAYNTIVR